MKEAAVARRSVVVAYVLTRFQFRLFMGLIKQLGIAAADCVLVIAKKAAQQGVTPPPGVTVFDYEEQPGVLGNEYDAIVDEIGRDFHIRALVMRNFNAKIAQRLLRLPHDALYLIEDGLASYLPRSRLALPAAARDKLKTLLVRVVHGRRLLPLGGCAAPITRYGFFPGSEAWAGGRFLGVDADVTDLPRPSRATRGDALFLEQPLGPAWTEMKRRAMESVLRDCGGRVYVFMHPSSTQADYDWWRDVQGELPRLEIVWAKVNVDEYYRDREIPQRVYAISSSALYVLKYLGGTELEAIAFCAERPADRGYLAPCYEALESCGVRLQPI